MTLPSKRGRTPRFERHSAKHPQCLFDGLFLRYPFGKGPKNMPKFAANISTLFVELPLIERFDAARAAGFSAVELPSPYDISAREILAALNRNRLELVTINAPPPNYTGGQRGFAAIPGGQNRFRYDLRRAMRYAEALGASVVHILAGNASGPEAETTFVENLIWATERAPKQLFTIKPLDPVNMPGFFLNSFELADAILDKVAAPNLALQFDTYHVQRITGDVGACWDAFGSRVGHVQIAGLKNRGEPIGDAFDFPAFFQRLDAAGFAGHVSAAYHPATTTVKGLNWFRRLSK